MTEDNAIDGSTQRREEGRQEGRQEGEAAILLRMLIRRFGKLSPSVEREVRGADTDQLREWGERFLTATHLDQIFDGQRG